jgi:hypothetical protein
MAMVTNPYATDDALASTPAMTCMLPDDIV